MSREAEAACRAVLLVLLLALPATAGAEEALIELQPGEGRDKVEAYCGACHSLDYIVMNSTFLSEQRWQAEVNKMINAFGAPISADDAKTISQYLGTYYGH